MTTGYAQAPTHRDIQRRVAGDRPLPGAGASLRVLVDILARDGWGELAGRRHAGVRDVLDALVRVLPAGSASGTTTAHQLALTSGLSHDYVRTRLHVLEDLGVLVWHRGGIREGRTTPSLLTVVKARVVELIAAARPVKAAREAVHALATAARVSRLAAFIRTPRRKRRSVHPALSAGLFPSGRGPGVGSVPGPVDNYVCPHGHDGAVNCETCARRARTGDR